GARGRARRRRAGPRGAQHRAAWPRRPAHAPGRRGGAHVTAVPDAEHRPQFRLPPAAYTSPSWAERERTHLFDRTWALVGDSAALAQPSDRVAVVVGGHPVLVLRDAAGRL